MYLREKDDTTVYFIFSWGPTKWEEKKLFSGGAAPPRPRPPASTPAAPEKTGDGLLCLILVWTNEFNKTPGINFQKHVDVTRLFTDKKFFIL